MREARRRTPHDGVAVAAALVLHALGLLLVARTMPERAAPQLPVSTAPDDIAIELGELAEPGELATSDASPSRAPGALPPSEPLAKLQPAKPAESPGITLEPSAASPDASEPEARTEPPPVSSAAPLLMAEPDSARPIDLGLGPDGWQRWLPPEGSVTPRSSERAARAPLVRAPPVSSTGGLQEGLEAKDKGRSAGPAGRVVNALENAAHGEGGTTFGVAHFLVTVLKSGTVEVKLENASQSHPEWQKIALRAAEDLRRKSPRVPPPREGLRLRIEIVAEEKFANGMRPSDLHGPRLEVAPPRFRSTTEAEREVQKQNPTAGTTTGPGSGNRMVVELPGVYLAQTGKVCGYRLGVSVLGPVLMGGCDPANAGVTPQRVVSAKVQSQELF